MNVDFEKIVSQVSQVIYGKKDQIRLALTCLFAGGHLLIEDIPGIGKTTMAKALAKCLGLEFTRIQYTSDLLPGDVLGSAIFDQHSGGFIFHKGPIFTQILLADEINRATPKTQSALLEAMEEHQVTTEGMSRRLPDPFFVIATLNPLEQAGTYSLPESQLDRFLMRISIGYPSREAENKILKADKSKDKISEITSILTTEKVIEIREKISGIKASDALLEYLQDIIDYTRTAPQFHTGLSPRAGLALLKTAKAWSFLNGKNHVLPEDIQIILPYVSGHRLHSSENFGEFGSEQLKEFFREVKIP